MAGVARRFGTGLALATVILCGALPLFAQHSGMGGGAPALLMLVVLLVLGVVVLRVIVAIFRWLFKKKPVSSPPPASIPPPASGPARTTAPKSTPTADRAIFISYRRQDSPHITGRIYDKLTSKFGKSAVFKDVENIPIGIDFRDHISKELKNCSVLLAVIGESWNPSSLPGGRRLDDPRDSVRIEIETALARGIPVIPVLVDGVRVPTDQELPASLARLAYHNGISIRSDPDFHGDADRLILGIESLFK